MRWSRFVPLLLPLVAACTSVRGVSAPQGTGLWSWPAETRPHRVTVEVDTLPARTALEYLVSPVDDPVLRGAAVETATRRGLFRVLGATPEEWAAELQRLRARAADPKSRLSLDTLRRGLDAVMAAEGAKSSIGAEVALRSVRLLADAPALETVDRLVLAVGTDRVAESIPLPPEMGDGLFLDPLRLFSELEEGSPAAVAERMTRVAAVDLYQLLRERQPAPAELPSGDRAARLLGRLAAEGPARYLSLGEDFLPLTRWLSGPLGEAWDRLESRLAALPADGERDPLEPAPGEPFWSSDVPLVGAVLVDSVIVVLGPARLRDALAAGPAALAAAYAEATRKDGRLRPLPEPLRRAAGLP